MLGQELDVILVVIFGILMVLSFLGKAGGIMDLFGPKNNASKKKRTPEEERAYQRAMGFFILPLFITELISVFWSAPVMGIVIAVVAVIDLIIFAARMKDK